MQQNELMHHGVKGMRWGHRKKNYVTVRQAVNNANSAAKSAAKESIAADKAKSKSGERVTYRQASKNARDAMNTARKESIAKDKAHNQQLRSNRATSGKKKAVAVMAAVGTLTVAAAAARHAQVGMRIMDIMYPGLLPGQYNR